MKLSIQQLYEHFKASAGVFTDTRNVVKNGIFFALKGDNFNGNTFATEALKNGAKLCVVDEAEAEHENCMLVENVLETLQALARFHRQHLNIPIVGLTGSNGKTTTKELMFCALNEARNTVATRGNLNNHIGVPLTILSITDKHEVAIVEMGANHQKEIEFLCGISQPDFGYITNFGKAHLEGFGGVEGVIKGKSELYDYLRASGKTAIVNADDPIQVTKSDGIESITFGIKKGDYNFTLKASSTEGFIVVATDDGTIETNLIGDYNFYNVAAAIAIAKHLQTPFEKIKQGIENYVPSNNRSQIIKTENNQVYLDAYNANPSSMALALKHFSSVKGTGKWVVLGDMFELGEDAPQEHQEILQFALSLDFERIILVGKHFLVCSADDKRIWRFATTEELLSHVQSNTPKGKQILVKGSRGMALEKVVPLL